MIKFSKIQGIWVVALVGHIVIATLGLYTGNRLIKLSTLALPYGYLVVNFFIIFGVDLLKVKTASIYEIFWWSAGINLVVCGYMEPSLDFICISFFGIAIWCYLLELSTTFVLEEPT